MRNPQVDEMLKLQRRTNELLTKILKQLSAPAVVLTSDLKIPTPEESKKEVEQRQNCVTPGDDDGPARNCFKEVLGR